MKILKPALAIILVLPALCSAATIAIDIQSGGKSLRDGLNNPLSGGNPAVNRDGTQVVLGYFSGATQANPFGTGGTDAFSSFTALTGPGTPWGVNFTIGDDVVNGTGNGEIFKDIFTISDGISPQLLPGVGTPLVLRFFDSNKTLVLDLANTAGLWNWKAPNTPPPAVNINLDDPGLVSRAVGPNNRGNASASAANLQTNNPVVPEPGSVLLLSLGLVSLAARRRRAA